ncbi:cytochrome P450 2U1-like [Anneissia japonica]|uniref:cytochrome P450 2U1-like n=1 Tax=Anneissia japonica TaxID=1529436 RepID=UPI001425530A|nr:cytochrome P450 2U1-like [Anneissia japonica]
MLATAVLSSNPAQFVLVFTTSILVVIVLVQRWSKNRMQNLPPSPWGLPFLGNILSIGENPHLTFMEMAKVYGNVFSVRMGRQRVTVLNGADVIREALVKQGRVFEGRPHLALTSMLTDGQGIVTADSCPKWKEQRRFTLHALRNFGVGKNSLEGKVMEEIGYLLSAMREKGKAAFNMDHFLEISVSNVICNVCFGRRFQYNEASFQLLVDSIYRFSEIGTTAAAVNFFPFLRHFPTPELKEVFQINQVMQKFLHGMIHDHKQTYDPELKRDFIDAYLGEIKRREVECPEQQNFFNETYLFHIINDLIFAGTETMSSTLRWALLYMIVFPDVQEKVQAELDRVCQGSVPSLKNRPNLPYTEATLMEIQRMANITALSYPHKTTESTELCGYNIPAGETIFVNLYSVHVDPKCWKDPEVFRPERFLDGNGNVISTQPGLMPFSAGRRGCPGETMARMELYLFFTSLFHNFKITSSPDNPSPSIAKHYGISLNPSTFNICVSER